MHTKAVLFWMHFCICKDAFHSLRYTVRTTRYAIIPAPNKATTSHWLGWQEKNREQPLSISCHITNAAKIPEDNQALINPVNQGRENNHFSPASCIKLTFQHKTSMRVACYSPKCFFFSCSNMLLSHHCVWVQCQFAICSNCEPAVRELIYKYMIKKESFRLTVLKQLSPRWNVNKYPQAGFMLAVVRRKWFTF